MSVEKESVDSRIEALALAIVREAIATRPAIYHNYTIHFFQAARLMDKIEDATPFARATYLPEGSWARVGRASIEDYGEYRLTLKLMNKRQNKTN